MKRVDEEVIRRAMMAIQYVCKLNLLMIYPDEMSIAVIVQH